MKIKINEHVTITKIDSTWDTCKYLYRVFIESEYFNFHYDEIREKLTEYFGAAEYFWNNMWLCELKPGCENIKHLYSK